jgi:hypothetical protein
MWTFRTFTTKISTLGANRPPPKGVECRLGSSIIKTASPKKIFFQPEFVVASFDESAEMEIPSKKGAELLTAASYAIIFCNHLTNQTRARNPRFLMPLLGKIIILMQSSDCSENSTIDGTTLRGLKLCRVF